MGRERSERCGHRAGEGEGTEGGQIKGSKAAKGKVKGPKGGRKNRGGWQMCQVAEFPRCPGVSENLAISEALD